MCWKNAFENVSLLTSSTVYNQDGEALCTKYLSQFSTIVFSSKLNVVFQKWLDDSKKFSLLSLCHNLGLLFPFFTVHYLNTELRFTISVANGFYKFNIKLLNWNYDCCIS